MARAKTGASETEKSDLGALAHRVPGDLVDLFARAFAAFLFALRDHGRQQDSLRVDPADAESNASSGAHTSADGRVVSAWGEKESTTLLASAPDWVQRAFEDATGVTEPRNIDPADLRAELMRDRLLTALRRRGMRQVDLGKQIGKKSSQVSRILKNPQKQQIETLVRIAEVLQVDLSDILRDIDDHKLAS